MIFGRKRKPEETEAVEGAEAPTDVEEDAAPEDGELDGEFVEKPDEDTPAEDDPDADDPDEEAEGEEPEDQADEDDPSEDSDEESDEDDAEIPEEHDWRADGPFDIDEVDLRDDGVTRIDLGSVVITPWEGLGLQLQVDEATRGVQAVTAVWKDSGLEISLFAAPTSGDLAKELREDMTEEAEQAGGTVTLIEGPFGDEIRRVLPQEGKRGEQLFHVSRIWFAAGPRWLLRATLLGEAAIADADAPVVAPFVEFFRNLVVRRGSAPMVPGELIPMTMPESVGEG